ncbi:nitroreductase family protein [Amycolatopsis sp. NPDC004747]
MTGTKTDERVVRPLLRRDAVVHRREGGAYLDAGDANAWFAGAAAYDVVERLLPYLTGRYSVAQICRGLPPRRREVVHEVVAALLERGVLLDAAAGERPDLLDRRVARLFRPQLRYLLHLADRPEERFHRFRTARVLATGQGAALYSAVSVLLRNGAADIAVHPDDGGWPYAAALEAEVARLRGRAIGCDLRIGGAAPEPGYDVVLRCVEAGGPAALTRPARPARPGDPPLLAAGVVGDWAVLGPAWRPGEPGCPGCAAARLGYEADDPSTGPVPLTPLVARMLGGSLGYAAFGLLTGIGTGDAPGVAVAQELRTLRTVRLPVSAGCPVCTGRTEPVEPVPVPPLVTIRREVVPDRPAATVRAFADAARNRVRTPMPPAAYVPDWADRPLIHSTYPGAPLEPLPYPAAPPEQPFGAGAVTPTSGFTPEALGWLLHHAYGPLRRRFRFDSNRLAGSYGSYAAADWARGTASGGGLYPLEIYWLSAGGIRHYAASHHAFERIADDDVTGLVARAVPHPDARSAAHHLVITARFWRTLFKYANFGYHVGSMDLGALLASIAHLGRGIGFPLRSLLWFDDDALNGLLGLDAHDESVLAVIPLPGNGGGPVPAGSRLGELPSAVEASRTVRHFAWAEHVHRATMLTAPAAAGLRNPVPAGADPPSGPVVALPPLPPEGRREPVSALLARRRSSAGGLTATPPVALAELGRVLSAAGDAGPRRTDVLPDDSPEGWTRLWVLATHVAGLAPGGYRYDRDRHALRPHGAGKAGSWTDALTRIGSKLPNYAIHQVAATVVVTGRLGGVLARYGRRGYRILTAEAGSVLQTASLAATAAGLGSGAVLGLDHDEIIELLGLPGDDERPMVCLLIGSENSVEADFDQPTG